jgi:hypothetical protein
MNNSYHSIIHVNCKQWKKEGEKYHFHFETFISTNHITQYLVSLKIFKHNPSIFSSANNHINDMS